MAQQVKPIKAKAKRRDFLKLLGLGGVAGAATLAAGGKEPAAQTGDKPEHPGYRESAHVRKYYETAKF